MDSSYKLNELNELNEWHPPAEAESIGEAACYPGWHALSAKELLRLL